MQQNSHFSNLAHIIKTANTIEVEGKSNVYACLKCVQELAIDPEVVCVFSAKQVFWLCEQSGQLPCSKSSLYRVSVNC
jgi:hypothetical protein